MAIGVGDKAPAFKLPGTPSGEFALSDYLGEKNVLLVFYPGDNTSG